MLKKILIALVVLVAGFAGVVAMQPSEFKVERMATIDAPPADVFAHVNDLHKWDAWSPWAKLDPNAKVGFEGAPAGQGAVFTWSGNELVGEGRMTIAESRPNEQVKINVAFVKPFEGTNSSEFTFKPEGNQTKVTWVVAGHNNFVAKAMCLIMNGKKMIGGEMEKGLAQLKSVGEANKG
jgi:Polyketide cyclase / dehydrase and lipid transport